MKRFVYIILLILMVGSTTVFAVDEDSGKGVGADSDPNLVQEELMQLGFQIFKAPVVAPDFTLKNLKGEDVSLSSLRGKTVLVNFWATWCPPCRTEMPSMERMYAEFKDENFELLAIDLQESEKTVQDFIDKYEYTFPILLDSNGRVASLYGARSIPTTFLIDENGFALGFIVGAREWDNETVYETLRNVLPVSD